MHVYNSTYKMDIEINANYFFLITSDRKIPVISIIIFHVKF